MAGLVGLDIGDRSIIPKIAKFHDNLVEFAQTQPMDPQSFWGLCMTIITKNSASCHFLSTSDKAYWQEMKPIIRLTPCILLLLIIGCSPKRHESKPLSTPNLTSDAAIRKMFPGAVPLNQYTDSLLFFLFTVHNIPQEKILLGQSTCMDDVLNTKNPYANYNVKGPFILGGLAGLPFTGITGYDAYAHHVPDSGTALLFIGPHIGYSKKDGWGKISRLGQHATSSCCGALSAALEKLEAGKIKAMTPEPNDYQEEVIEQLALEHSDEILKSEEPLVTFSKVIYKEAERRIDNIPLRQSNFKYLVLVVGVVINTDNTDPDYIWVDHMSIYNLYTEREIKGMMK